MELRDIDEEERQELDRLTANGKAELEKLIDSAEKKGFHDAAAAYRKLHRLYDPRVIDGHPVSGLATMFNDQTALEDEVDRKRAAAGEKRDVEGQQDMFGGGAEIGGGVPAGQIVTGVKTFATPDEAEIASMRAALAEIGALPAETIDMTPELVAQWAPAGPYGTTELPIDDANGRPEATWGLTENGVRLDAGPDAGEYATQDVAQRRAAWLNMRERIADMQSALYEAEAARASVSTATPTDDGDVVADYEIVDGEPADDATDDEKADAERDEIVDSESPYESADDDEVSEAPPSPIVVEGNTFTDDAVPEAEDPWDEGPAAHRTVPAPDEGA